MFAEDGELTKTYICGATKIEIIENLNINVIEMKIPTNEELDAELSNEEYKELIDFYQIRETQYMNLTTGISYCFSFDKQASSHTSLVFYSISVLQKDEYWDDFIQNDISFTLYSTDDLLNPILSKEHAASNIDFDETNPLSNGKYYLLLTIEELGKETILYDIKISASYLY